MDFSDVKNHIVNWLDEYANQSNTKGFVVGISGGIDSAVTSTLCALTGRKVICLNMPIHQPKDQLSRAEEHINWLKERYAHVESYTVDLTNSFETLTSALPNEVNDQLSLANTRARIRMTTLYAIAGNKGMLVAGTGNKIEDFGIGFFTKYGDGGVDLSPIADLTKSEVFNLAKELNVINSIQTAKPTDGLWEDDRSDEDQIGASYPELEWAMTYLEGSKELTDREKEVLDIYNRLNKANQHKMNPIPVCVLPPHLKNL